MGEELRKHWFFIWLTAWVSLRFVEEWVWLWGLVLILLTLRLAYLHKSSRLVALVVTSLLLGLFFHQNSQYQKQATLSSGIYYLELDPRKLKASSSGSWQGQGILLTDTHGRVPVQVFLTADQLPDLPRQVQIWQVKGDLSRPDPARNFGVFDYRKYLKRQGVYWILRIREFSQVYVKKGPPWREKSLVWRAWLQERSQAHPWLALYAKVLWNLDSSTYRTYKDYLKPLGLLHLFAISGFHLTYLRRALRTLFLRSGFLLEWTVGIVEGILWIYAYLICFPVGVIRSLACRALQGLADRYDLAWTSSDCLALVGLLCLFIQPRLAFDLGYLLSFMMTLLVQAIKGHVQEQPSWLAQMEVTLACLLFSWPLFIWLEGEWVYWQILSVWLFTWFFEWLFIPGLFYLSLGLLWPHLLPTGGGTISGSLPLGLVVGQPSLFWLGLLYVAAILWLYYLPNRVRAYLAVFCIYGAFLVAPYLMLRPRVTVLDVGQGDSLLYQSAYRSQTYLIDTGGRLRFGPGGIQVDPKHVEEVLLPALKARGVSRIHGLIITHPDLDHAGNLLGLLEHLPVEAIYLTAYSAHHPMFERLSPDRLQVLPSQSLMALGDLRLYAPMNYDDSRSNEVSNASSLVTWFSLGNETFLTTGDLEEEGELRLLKSFPQLRASLLKLGHHGSQTSSHPLYLDHHQAHLALISSGLDNPYGHPHPEVLDHLADRQIPVYNTGQVGAIELSPTWSGQVKVRTALPITD